MRWLANAETPFQQINNLADERGSDKLVEVTIRFRNLEWTFSCSRGDAVGHHGTVHGTEPHYHLQMKIDGRPFIAFGDFHPPLNRHDPFVLDVQQGKIPGARHRFTRGAGMQEALDVADPPRLLAGLKATRDDAKGTFNLTTIVDAGPGAEISDVEIARLQQESELTGVPLAVLLRRLETAEVTTIISPGPAVPTIAARTPRKRGKRKRGPP